MEKIRILIVEDEAITAMEIESNLQSIGYEVTSIVDTGKKAIEKAELDKPDIVLMDIKIKGKMDGVEAAKIIWSRFAIPIVFTTAYLGKQRIENSKITAPFGHVLKPIQERELRLSIEMTLHISKIIIQRNHAEKKLKESEKQLSDLHDSMIEGVCQHELVYDESGKPIDYRILNVNPQYEKILNLNRSDVIGKLSTEVYKNSEAPYLEIYSEVVRSGKAVRFEIFFLPLKKYFSISAFSPEKGKFATVFENITERKINELALQQQTHNLKERVKELYCLYGITKLIEKSDHLLPKIFKEVVELIPPAWQYSDITCARLIINDQEFKTENFKESIWKQTVKIKVHGKQKGILEVFYLEKTSTVDESPFLKEERNLINAIAVRVGKIIEQSQAEENLLEANQQLLQLSDRLKNQNIYLQEEIKLTYNFGNIIGKNKKFLKILNLAEKVAPSQTTVLITGETGTGKELIARIIHELSDRKDFPLIKVNCAGLPANLIESELFGYEKGAFTGAIALKKGRFELADNTTIFLDEIGDLPLDLQSKLLRVLQEGEFERLGGTKTLKVNVRVLAATNKNLRKLSETGKFRSDLLYRLDVFPIECLPLRDRKDDIPLLVKHFIEIFNVKIGKNIKIVPKRVLNILQEYHWPGNIRELQNILERAVILSSGNQLELGDWLTKNTQMNSNSSILSLDQLQKKHILHVLKLTNGKVSGDAGAAKILGLNRATLQSRMKKLGIKMNRITAEISAITE
jgi:transcriptional regulator with GAF, ATPase, and Fis domain/AmiR/NasT family two-component response regulator